MIQSGTQIFKWSLLPLFLTGALFSPFAAEYESLLNLAVCLGAVAVLYRAACDFHYFWGAGALLVAVVFSPLSLAIKIFLLMGLTCLGACAALTAALRAQPVPARPVHTN